MKLIDVYKRVVDFGMKMDPRGKEKVGKSLQKAKKEYEKLSKPDKALYDKERFVHPYTDTRILFGKPDTEVKAIFVGIDIEVGEVLLADRLRQRGEKIDLLLSHHPEGKALANFYNVMDMQIDILNKVGVPVSIAENLTRDRIKEVERKVAPVNHMRSVDAARLLDIAFMTCHTPADNCVASYLQKIMDKRKPDTLEDVMGILRDIPEYKESEKYNSPPKIIRGSASSKTGRVFVDMTGGTESSKKVIGKLSQAGVSTLVCMHLGEEHFKKAQGEYLNVIIAGHIASDNLGLNLVLDELEKKAKFKLLSCSGFRRFLHRK